MKVLMLRNAASSVGCLLREGETGDVPDNMGRQLVAFGLAECLDPPKEQPPKQEPPKKIEAIPEPPIEAVPEKPAVVNTPSPSPLAKREEAPKADSKAARHTSKPKNQGAN